MQTVQELEELFEKYWENENGYIVMPYTIRARAYLAVIADDIHIEAVLDNNDALDNTYFGSIQIKDVSKFLKENISRNGVKKKILVSAHYSEIAEQLKNAGYVENIDFIDMHMFVSMYYWRKKGEIHILDVHTAVTTYCSLNCKNCNMFINHYADSRRRNIGMEEFRENFNALFRNVDYCYKVSILGGEPLLNKELPQMLDWLHKEYGSRVGQIVIVTNGTVPVQEKLIKVLKETGAKISISDYTASVPYDEKLKRFEDELENSGIEFEINKEMKWKNFFFPKEKQKVGFESAREHMLCCNPVFRGLNDKKFYYCHIVWSAVQAGLLKEDRADFVDLEDIKSPAERKKLLLHDLGFVENGSISLCRYCGGCGSDNESLVVAGVQE